MTLAVQREVVGAREAALADLTLKRFGAGVLAVVSREFVGSGEPPLTFGPMALRKRSDG